MIRAGLRGSAALAGTVLAAWGQAGAADFTNVTDQVGLAGKPGFRLSVADVNGDGYPDILLHRQANYGAGDWFGKSYLYLNVQGDDPSDPFSRKFVDVTAESGIRANRQGTATGRHSDGAVFADVDNDGDLDMFTPVYVHENLTSPTDKNDLMLNDGAGHFTLAPASTFHQEMLYNTAAAVFTDYDNDGKVDLFIGNWYRSGALTQDQLYRGGGDGTFANVTASSGVGSATTSVYGIAAWDWNGDGYADLFAPPYSWTVFGSTPIHWKNNGNGTFSRYETVSNYDQDRGFLSGVASFGSMPADFDNDGDVDFFEILTHGAGDGAGSVHSTAVANVAGVFSWDYHRVDGRDAEDPDITHHGDHYESWFDYDNDGLLDFALTESGYGNNRIYLFRQAPDHTFSPVTAASGLDEINDLDLPPHNVLPVDYDLDGDEDLLVGFADDVTGIRMYRNDVGTANRWLVVTVEGGGGPGQSNRAAVGARVRVTAGGSTRTREVYAGNGHLCPQVPLSQHFGLGSAEIVDSVEVRWPNASLSTTRRTYVPANRFIRIREGCAGPPDPANLRADRSGGDVVLSWDDAAPPGTSWSVYRDGQPDPSLWGAPIAPWIGDGDPSTPGIQYRDAGAASSASSYFYLVTAVNECGETDLR